MRHFPRGSIAVPSPIVGVRPGAPLAGCGAGAPLAADGTEHYDHSQSGARPPSCGRARGESRPVSSFAAARDSRPGARYTTPEPIPPARGHALCRRRAPWRCYMAAASSWSTVRRGGAEGLPMGISLAGHHGTDYHVTQIPVALRAIRVHLEGTRARLTVQPFCFQGKTPFPREM